MTQENNPIYRPIEKKDNAALAGLIRKVFREFHIDLPGTVYTDPTTDHLYEVFEKPKSSYWIAENTTGILGGCGIFPTDGLPEGCAELVKFYLSPNARGLGIGKTLMQKSISSARQWGYSQIYLESFPELATAIGMYENAGFRRINRALGNSGHYACNVWMLLDL